MKTIDLARRAPDRITVLSYGHMRSGKTRFAASWPRPLFLADATEGGWTTIQNMDRSALFEPDRFPIVCPIEKIGDMMEAIRDVQPMIQDGRVKTIVIDSLTFYADLYLNTMASLYSGKSVDLRQLYASLGSHLRQLRIDIHALRVNVVWLCLAKEPNEETPTGGPLLPGQNASKFAAGCDYVFYHRSFQVKGELHWEIRTRSYERYMAGGRDEGRLPDPLGFLTQGADGEDVFVRDCTYRTMAETLGLIAPSDSEPVPQTASEPAQRTNRSRTAARV